MVNELFSASELLKPADVARLLQVPESTLAVWRSTGRVQLPYIRIGGAVRYRPVDVAKLVTTGLRGNEAL